MRRGFPKELARRRIAVGCNWMAIPGIEYPLNDSIKVNFAKVLEVALWEMFSSGERSTRRLFELFSMHLKIVMQVIADTTDMHLRQNYTNNPELFLNLVSVGPIEKGRDASDHSMEYYNIGVDGAGIAVAADSFAALEQRVEREKAITWEEVEQTLKTDYEGERGAYIQALMKSASKFGQRNSLGEEWARRICGGSVTQTDWWTKAGRERYLFPGCSPGENDPIRKDCRATPDGRKAGIINHGANPMPGSVPNGAMTTMSGPLWRFNAAWATPALSRWSWIPASPRHRAALKR